MAKQGSNRNLILAIGGGVLVLCVCICVVVAGVLAVSGGGIAALIGTTKPVADAGDKFMNSPKDGNYDAAYKQMDPSLQRKYGNAQRLRQAIESDQLQPTKWNFSSVNIDNDTGSLSGNATLKAGPGTVALELRKTGDNWLITDFELSPD